jgi:hypothetical protein
MSELVGGGPAGVLRKFALTACDDVIVTVHVNPETEPHPVQPPKVVFSPGTPLKVTSVPLAKLLAQAVKAGEVGAGEPQLMAAGMLLTVPCPAPDTATERALLASANVTVTIGVFETLMVHFEPETESQPFQPTKFEFAAGTAVKVTVAPVGNEPVHSFVVALQLIPVGILVMVPLPTPASFTTSCFAALALLTLSLMTSTLAAVP